MTEILEILDSFSNEDPETPVETPKEKAEYLIKFMDVDNSGGITFDEFLKVGKLLLPIEEDEDED